MTLAAAPSAPAVSPAECRPARALAVADVNWFTTENLFRALDPGLASALLLRCDDYLNAWRRGGRPWGWNRPARPIGPGQWRRDLALPPGWMKRYPELGMRPIARTVAAWRRREARGLPLTLVATYPHYLHLTDRVRPDRLVYLNVDDYTLYWPGAAGAVRDLECRMVEAADLTVCTAALRAEELRAAVPGAAGKVRHLPHGAPAGSIAERPWHRPAPPPPDVAALPRPLLGYVGTLGDRVDWDLVARLAREFPGGSVVLVGRVEGGEIPARTRCLGLPNVYALGWRPQASIHAYNRAFDVCLIPYAADHPFNVACCPTKIMDTMGSGRPMVSTDLPECRLSAHLFDVAPSPEAFVAAVESIVAAGSVDGRGEVRWDWARRNACDRVAARLLEWAG